MKILYFLFAFAVLLGSCKSSTEETTTTEEETTPVNVEIEKVGAVCISNGVPIRAEPHKGGKYISSLNLGETFLYLGENAADSNDAKRTYYKVELSDGTVAWARTYGVRIEATPAAITSNTPIYKRPDLVTKTDKSLSILEFIAVISEKEEWVEVVGASGRKSGWIKKMDITTNQEDVAVATLASKNLLNDGEVQVDKIADFLGELPYENSQFVSYLQNILDAQVEEAVVDAIEEYEEVSEDEAYD